MTVATVIFPHQLFSRHPGVVKGRRVYLVEEPRFFVDSGDGLSRHKLKLMFHRASMRAYADRLRDEGMEVNYIPFGREAERGDWWRRVRKDKVGAIFVGEVADRVLTRRIEKKAKGMKIRWLESPGFLTPMSRIRDLFTDVRHYSMTSFYISQRRRLGVLVREDGGPVGGQWSFDPANRKSLPKGITIPKIPAVRENDYVREARSYVEERFARHPGMTERFIYPVTHEAAERWLDNFLRHRLRNFGDYEDAIDREEPILFHSVLSPLLNVGLLTPAEVVERTLAFAERGNIPLNSLEGFLRQVIGWREFVRGVYELEGERQMAGNFWGHDRKLSKAFYNGTTGVEPVDSVIRQVSELAYGHHIQRLMVLGNFMLLCEIDPKEVYAWFMEMFIDAYEWVMVPNVFGMSQFADGGLMMTKPYVSGSNYIRKMSNFPKGRWCEVWDGLFWRFIDRHLDFYRKNARMAMMARKAETMGREKMRKHIKTAETFLEGLER